MDVTTLVSALVCLSPHLSIHRNWWWLVPYMMQEEGEAIVQAGVKCGRPKTCCNWVIQWSIILSNNVVARACGRRKEGHYKVKSKLLKGTCLKVVMLTILLKKYPAFYIIAFR